MEKVKQLITLLFFATICFGCSVTNQSHIKPPKEMNERYVNIPEGWAYLDNDSVRVNGFFMAKYEISNIDYLKFLNDLHKQNRQEEYLIALPDTTQWSVSEYSAPLIEHYFRHPAYHGYPVVNISHQAALLYCEWLTETWNSSQDDYVYEFRLPHHHEWVRAAQGGERRIYAWDSPYLRDETGVFRANFKPIPNENLTSSNNDTPLFIADQSQKKFLFDVDDKGNPGIKWTITTPVDSYKPGVFGLYNMNGNAAEMLQQPGIAAGGNWNSLGYDIRNIATSQYENPNPFTGFRLVMVVKKK